MRHLVRLHTAVVELTLACPNRCITCGSSAGVARKDELSFDEWDRVFGELAGLGCQRLTFSGGEPLLREDFTALARGARKHGLIPDMITSGMEVDEDRARKIYESGIRSATISVDGTRDIHDKLRGVSGSYDLALYAIRKLDRAGLKVGVSTQVNRWNLSTLAELAPELQRAGALGWQLQLTMPAGRAAQVDDLVVEPDEMPKVHRTIRRLIKRKGLRPFVTDNIGYLTSDDPVLRTPPQISPRCWLGCFAGIRAVAITSNGGVKGCLSLPDSLIEGQVRERPLAEIWTDPALFVWNRDFTTDSLSGACKDCRFGRVCRGGCSSMALAVHGVSHRSSHCFRLVSL